MKIILIAFLFFQGLVFSQTIVLNEDFQNGIPSTWTLVNDTNTVNSEVSEYTGAWIALTDPENVSDSVASATSYFATPADANRWLISPAINLSAFGNYLTWEAKSHDPSFTDDYLVLISTTSDFSSNVDTLLMVLEENYVWESHEINLSELGYDNQTIYIAFVLNTYDGFKLYLDDVQVRAEDPVAVSELGKTSLNVYPNPCTDFFEVKNDLNFDFLEVFNELGQQKLKSYINKIDVKTLESGVYFVRVHFGEFSEMKRIVVKH